jgi:hypothetical protein
MGMRFLGSARARSQALTIVVTAAITLACVIVALNLTAGEKNVTRQIGHL